MKIQVEQRNLSVEGALESKAARIRSSATMMAALAGLYSDPRLAVVREYATNMLDGYTRLKKLHPTTPYRAPVIHLPNAFEPYIEFTDYGIGMDYEEVWNTFTDFGGSTKQDSNEEVGGLGLGAKTAFTYSGADVWTIESRYDGKRHIIHATKDETGIPKYYRMASLATEEPNGVTIRIPVKPDDFQGFIERVAKVLVYYPMEVTIVGGKVEVEKPTYLFQGKNWGIRKTVRAQYDWRGKVSTPEDRGFVIMGNVAYPIVPSHFKGKSEKLLNQNAFDLYLPIGSCDITPSRESLKYTEATIRRVNEALHAAADEVVQLVEQQLKSAPTLWEALKIARNLEEAKLVTDAPLKWKDKEFVSTMGLEISPTELKKRFPEFRLTTYFRRTQSKWEISENVDKAQWIRPDGKAHVFLRQDEDKLPIARSKFYLEQHGGDWMLLVEGAPAAEVLSKELGGVPVQPIDTLPTPPANARGTRTKTRMKVWGKDGWRPVDVAVEDGGIYVGMEDNGILPHEGQDWSDGQAKLVLDAAITLGILEKGTELFAIPRTHKHVERKPGWTHLFDAIKPSVPGILEANKHDVATWRAWADTINRKLTKLVLELPDDKRATFTQRTQEILAETTRVAATAARMRHVIDLSTHMGIAIPKGKPLSVGSKLYKELYDKYPMLEGTGALLDGFYGTSEPTLKIVKGSIIRYLTK